MITADCVVSRCNQLLTCGGPIPKRGNDLKDVGVLTNGSIASSEGRIVFVGKDEDLRKKVRLVDGGTFIDGQGYVGLPGLVDSHTHLPLPGAGKKSSSCAWKDIHTSNWRKREWEFRQLWKPQDKPPARRS